MIPHGIPAMEFERRSGTDAQMHLPGRRILLTFGLLHGHKGCQFMIRAMRDVIREHPDATYVILGTPHPNGLNVQEYYNDIKKEAADLNLTDTESVVFVNEFASNEEVKSRLRDAALYVNPYTDRMQAVSGTLALALGTGSAIVSTPFPYATSVLANGVGTFVPFEDSTALASTVISLLKDGAAREEFSKRAYAFAQSRSWTKWRACGAGCCWGAGAGTPS